MADDNRMMAGLGSYGRTQKTKARTPQADMAETELAETDMDASHISAPMPAITLWQRAAVKPVRVVLCISLLAAVHLLGGCVSTFGLQSDGTYLLERRETDATCDELYKRMWGRIELIKKLPAKAMAEQASPPATAFSMFGRWFGSSSKGLKAVEEYDRELAHAYALERTMRERKCVSVDLEREIAEAASSIARIRQN